MEHYIATGSVLAPHKGSIRTKPLTYLASESVFEHLEANTRFLLATHCPSLRSLHSRLPLRISYLKIGQSGAHINQYVHSFEKVVIEERPCKVISELNVLSKSEKECLRLDPVPQGSVSKDFVIHYIRNDTGKQEICKIPGNDTENARDILLRTIFHRTSRSIVDRYEAFPKFVITNFGLVEFKNPPEAIKVQVKEFVIPANEYAQNNALKLNLPLLHPESFPLKKLFSSVQDSNEAIFENEVLKSAKCVDISISNYREWHLSLAKLNNEIVTIRGLGICERLIFRLTQNLFDRDIGTVLNVMHYFDDKKLNGSFRTLKSSTGMKAQTKKVDGHECSCYAFDFNKELNIYYKKYDKCLVMKVMKAGSAI